MSADHVRAILYLPLPEVGDTRLMSAISRIEASFPSRRLTYTYDQNNQLVRQENRTELLVQIATTIDRDFGGGGIFFLCTDDLDTSEPLMTASGLTIPGALVPGGKPIYEFSLTLPEQAPFVDRAAELLAELGPTLTTYWGDMVGEHTAVRLADQVSLGAPPLEQWHTLASPWVPARVGWLNYWSSQTATLLGFPDLTRDADLLSRAMRTRDGGWVVAVTKEPLDLDVPEHVEALRRLYDRFPQIGGRDRVSDAP